MEVSFWDTIDFQGFHVTVVFRGVEIPQLPIHQIGYTQLPTSSHLTLGMAKSSVHPRLVPRSLGPNLWDENSCQLRIHHT